jgi:hypothetical protein
MNTYRIPCTWTVAATMEIQANSLEEAIEIANEAPLPTDTDYIEDTFEVNNQIIPYLNKNLTEQEMREHCGEVIRW